MKQKKKYLLRLALIVFAVLLIGNAMAQGEDPCKDPQTQAQINACAASRYKEADVRLNEVYNRLILLLDDPRKARLRAAQLAWIKFRDAHCEFMTAEHAGASIYPVLQYGCLAPLTEARTEELKMVLEEVSKN
jgi:uncharacterized protein YecT (DUF1311 family)